MKLLLYSFLFGIIHLFAGLAVRFYMLWKDGKKLTCDVVWVHLLVAGIAPLGAGIIIDAADADDNSQAGVALVGAVLTVLTSGRSAKILSASSAADFTDCITRRPDISEISSPIRACWRSDFRPAL